MVITPKKSEMIQMLRGLAICAVVSMHTAPQGLPQVFIGPFHTFCVGTFLFLSGLLSDAKKWHPLKRLKKVLIPYAIWTLVYVFIHKDPALPLSRIPLVYLYKLCTAQAEGPLYYIFVYCAFTLLIPLIDKLARSKYKLLGFVISPYEIAAVRLLPLVSGFSLSKGMQILTGISFLPWFHFFYLGYLLGNGLLQVKASNKKLIAAYILSVPLQMAEGFWHYQMGSARCGTQLKLSCLLTTTAVVLLAYRLIESEACPTFKALTLLGDCSFGIYYAHYAVIAALQLIPGYKDYVIYPLNTVVTVAVNLCLVLLGKRLLGKYSRYLAF